MDREQVFAELQKRGAAFAVVSFYGGGDEGHVESIALHRAPEDPARPFGDSIDSEIDPYDDRFGEALSRPIYDRYGSFAGDFSVSGVCVWNVAERSAYIEVEESEYIHHSYEA